MNLSPKGGYQNPGVFILGSILFLPFILLGLDLITVPVFIGGLVMIVYLTLLVVNFEIGFLTLIFIRSSLDYLKNISAGGLNVAAAVSVVLIVLGVFYILYRKSDIFKFEDTKPFLLFIGMCALSVTYAPSKLPSFLDLVRLISVFSVYILTRMLFVTEQKIKAGFTCMLLSALLPASLAVIQFITGQGLVMDGGHARIVGTFIHPNAFASYLLIILVFSMSQILEKGKFLNKAFMTALVGVLSIVFLLTFSRGAWIVFVVSLLFMGVVRYRKLLGLVPIALVLAVVAVPGVRARIMDAVDPEAQRGRSAWEWRLDTWSEVQHMVEQRPIFGHGLATVELEFGVLTHNDYLRLLAETGALGFLSYIFLAGYTLWRTRQDYKASTSNIAKSFQLGLMAIIIGFLIRQLADNTLRNTVVMIYFWAFVALVRNLTALYAPPKEYVPSEARNA